MWDEVLNLINHKITPQKAVAYWGGDVDSIVLISTGVNLVYRFHCHGNRYYLRVTHHKLRSMRELESALAFQDYLARSGIPVCQLICSQRGNQIESIQQGENTFLAHVCAEVRGQAIDFNSPNASLYQNWGKALARLHDVSARFKSEDFKYGCWAQEVIELNDYCEHEKQYIQVELKKVIDYLSHYSQNPKNYGLIHGDHRKGNVFTDGEHVYFIDFDLPRFCWFMDDISRPFFSSIVQDHQNWQDKLTFYLKGYFSIQSLARELETFPWFIRYKLLSMYLWTKNNWKNDIMPGGHHTRNWLNLLFNKIINQEWLKDLKTQLPR
ncbi:MAG: phosphotransferase [Pseudomonadota bacterium]